MASYFLKISDREEGPYSDDQVSQLFADSRVGRDTPCRMATNANWKTIDEYLPMLKYGTQVPVPSSPVVRSEEPGVYHAGQPARGVVPQRSIADFRVSVVDVDLPFLSILKLLFKWAGAGVVVAFCFIPAFIIFWIVLFAIFAVLGGVFSGIPRP